MIEIRSTCCGTLICIGASAKRALERAVEDGVSLRYANLSGLYLAGIQLRGADMGYADLTNTILNCAVLRGASIAHAKTRGARFRCADLRGVCNTDAYLYPRQIMNAQTSGMWTRYG